MLRKGIVPVYRVRGTHYATLLSSEIWSCEALQLCQTAPSRHFHQYRPCSGFLISETCSSSSSSGSFGNLVRIRGKYNTSPAIAPTYCIQSHKQSFSPSKPPYLYLASHLSTSVKRSTLGSSQPATPPPTKTKRTRKPRANKEAEIDVLNKNTGDDQNAILQNDSQITPSLMPLSIYSSVRLQLLLRTHSKEAVEKMSQTMPRKRVRKVPLKGDASQLTEHSYLLTVSEEMTILGHMLQTGTTFVPKMLAESMGRTYSRVFRFWAGSVLPSLYADQAYIKKKDPQSTLMTLRILAERRLNTLASIIKYMDKHPALTKFSSAGLASKNPNASIIVVGRLGSHLYSAHRPGPWTPELDNILLENVRDFGLKFSSFMADLPGYSGDDMSERYLRLLYKHGKEIEPQIWTPEEVHQLERLIKDTSEDRTPWVELKKAFPNHTLQGVKKKARELVIVRSQLTREDFNKIGAGVAKYGRHYFGIKCQLDFPNKAVEHLISKWVVNEPPGQPNALWTAEDDTRLMSMIERDTMPDLVKPEYFPAFQKRYFPDRWVYEIILRYKYLAKMHLTRMLEKQYEEYWRDVMADPVAKRMSPDGAFISEWKEKYNNAKKLMQDIQVLRGDILPKRLGLLWEIKVKTDLTRSLAVLRAQPHVRRALFLNRTALWTDELDLLLQQTVAEVQACHGYIDWSLVSKKIPESEMISCRWRWFYLQGTHGVLGDAK
ncbi:hypothetical protein BASA83_009672 [Batrachochytrium salamandrivorans]|nr:hypothetical protein BASA83_009672 [Batrachochytrium salamandrivorans]